MRDRSVEPLDKPTQRIVELVTGDRQVDHGVLRNMCDAIVALLGERCEAVIHDFSDFDRSIVYMAGNVTGRSVGGPVSDMGLRLLISAPPDQDVLFYYSRTSNGTLIKTATILLRAEPLGELIGAVCINLDIEHLQRARIALEELITLPREMSVSEDCPSTPRQTLEHMVNDILDERGWIISDLARNQRIEMIRLLEERGAFSYRSAKTVTAELLGVSRYTIYKYLQHIRETNDTSVHDQS